MKRPQSESLVHILLDEPFVAYWDWDIAGNKAYLSDGLKNILGYSSKDVLPDIPDILANLIVEEDYPSVITAYKTHVASKGLVPYEVRVRYHSKTGGVVHVQSKGRVTEWDKDDNPLRMVGIHTDITTLIKNKEALRKKTEQQQLIVEGINAGIWDWDIQTGKEWWSPRFYELLGYAENEIEPSYHSFLHELLHPEDRQPLESAVDKHLASGILYKLDIRLKKKDGSYGWFETSGKAKFDTDGKPLQMVGSISSIDERKRIQLQLENTRLLLTETSSMTKVGGWDYDVESGIVNWSDEVYKIHKLPEGLQPTMERVNALYTPESRQKLNDAIAETVRQLKPYDLELRSLTSAGEIKWVRAIGKPTINSSGQVTGLRGTVQDIHEQKLKELQLQHSYDIIAEQNKRLFNFAHIVSHNLRSHVANIQTTVSVLQISNDQQQRGALLHNLEKTAGILQQTITHLNEVVQVQTEISKSRSVLYFEEVFTGIVCILQASIDATGAVIEKDFSASPSIEYVPSYLESILLNLVSNALRYRHPERQPQILVKTFIHNNRIVLAVQDNGLGIDLEKYGAKLFGMYNTFHSNPESRGIGLFITKNQVEALGGTIQVESTPGYGASFRVVF